MRLSITRASRVVRHGGNPDTTSAIDSVGISWMRAIAAFHERSSNLRQDDLRDLVSRSMLQRLLFSGALLIVCGSFLTARAQDKVNVSTISSQTADLVTFKIYSPKSSYGPNQNIPVNYTVTNSSRKVAYLVLEPTPQPKVDEKKRFLAISSPVKDQSEWNRYDNDLIRILPGHSFSGKLVINGTKVPGNPKSEFESWEIQVVFAYIFAPAKSDIDELLACKETTYSYPCLGKLDEVAKHLTVGNLVVEVRSR